MFKHLIEMFGKSISFQTLIEPTGQSMNSIQYHPNLVVGAICLNIIRIVLVLVKVKTQIFCHSEKFRGGARVKETRDDFAAVFAAGSAS